MHISAWLYKLMLLTKALRESRPPWQRQIITPILPGFPIWRVTLVIQITPINGMNCVLYFCRAIMKLSLKFVHNLLSNGQISN